MQTPEQLKKILTNTLGAIKTALTTTLGATEGRVIAVSLKYVTDAESRISTLLSAVAGGEVDIRFVLKRLDDEKKILLSQLLSLEVIGKGIAEQAINNAQDILLSAIGSVLPQ